MIVANKNVYFILFVLHIYEFLVTLYRTV